MQEPDPDPEETPTAVEEPEFSAAEVGRSDRYVRTTAPHCVWSDVGCTCNTQCVLYRTLMPPPPPPVVLLPPAPLKRPREEPALTHTGRKYTHTPKLNSLPTMHTSRRIIKASLNVSFGKQV